MEEIQKVKTITPIEVGKILGKSPERIRAGLKNNRFPFGTAIPPKKEGGNWNYIIIESKFLEYVGKANKKRKLK